MKIHLIAIGGSIMHNLAIALHKKGFEVGGSDDVIYEPAYSRLHQYGLLPEFGWFPEKISTDIDIIILGMHAKADNPELARARELRIPVVSFPEFLFQQAREKKRVVVAGSHGKTTVTSMIMHVLQKLGFDFDYAVGSTLPGFEDSVRLSNEAPLIIIEGDEYLSSVIDPQPKMMWYKPHIALINGIAWDHINVFPTYEEYKEQFSRFISKMEPASTLVYFHEDEELRALVEEHASHLRLKPTFLPDYRSNEDGTLLHDEGREYPLTVFGKHNMQNLMAAQSICGKLGISADNFWKAAADFTGAGKRLEKVPNDKGMIIYRDFAHAPSKVTASVNAVDEQYPHRKLLAVLELHTYSSLNKDFIRQYAGSMDKADTAIVYADYEALRKKGTTQYSAEEIRKAFQNDHILFIEQKEKLEEVLLDKFTGDEVLLMMSSGNLGGLNLKKLIEEIA